MPLHIPEYDVYVSDEVVETVRAGGGSRNLVSDDTGLGSHRAAKVLAILRGEAGPVQGGPITAVPVSAEAADDYDAARGQPKVTVKAEGAHLSVTVIDSDGIKNPEDAIERGVIDPDRYKIDKWRSKPFNAHQSGPDGEPVVLQLYSSQFDLTPREAEPTQFAPVQPVAVSVPRPSPRPVRRADGLETALVFGDRQYGFKRHDTTGELEPMHDRAAIDVVVQMAERLRPDRLLDLGDVLDLAEWSLKFVREPSYTYTTQASICEAGYDNGRLVGAAPDARFDILEGNHDRRIEQYILANAKAAYGLRSAADVKAGRDDAYTIPSLLGLDALGVHYSEGYPDGEVWINDGLRAVHGTIAKAKSGQTATALAADSPVSTIQGHVHRYETAGWTEWVRGEPQDYVAAVCPCLCRVDGAVPGVKKRQNWQQGLFVVTYDPAGSFHQIEHVPIRDGRAYWRGEWIVGAPDVAALSEASGYQFQRAA